VTLSSKLRIKAYALACLMACAAGLSNQSLAVELPSMGDTSGAIVSPDEERRMGEGLMRQVRQSTLLVEDPEVSEYIQSLGYQLVANSDSPAQDFTFFVINDPTINAFAAPGGFIGIHIGLVLAAESESELASVLAHEIVHVTQRHLARAIEKANKMNVPATAALLAALILSGSNPQIGQAAVMATMAGSVQNQLNFTRAHEQEADRLGMQILANAGFNPRSMPLFFERMQQASRFYDNRLPEFLRTHPVTLSRIADSRNRAEQYSVKGYTEREAYRLIRAKLRVLSAANPASLIKTFEDAAKKGRQSRSDERYGYALALLAASRYSEARTQIKKLLEKDPNRIAYLIASADIDMADKQPGAAASRLSEALKLFPNNHPLTMTYAEALLNDGEAETARLLLKDHLRSRDPSPALYALLARAEKDAGYAADAHQSLAEYYYLSGETRTAIDQLNIALRLVQDKDFYRASRIEARLKELQERALAEAKQR